MSVKWCNLQLFLNLLQELDIKSLVKPGIRNSKGFCFFLGLRISNLMNTNFLISKDYFYFKISMEQNMLKVVK